MNTKNKINSYKIENKICDFINSIKKLLKI